MMILTVWWMSLSALAGSVEIPEQRVMSGAEEENACTPGSPCRVVALVPTAGVGVTRASLGEPSVVAREVTAGLGLSLAWFRGNYVVDNQDAAHRRYRLDQAAPVLYLGVSTVGGLVEGTLGAEPSFGIVGLVGSHGVALTGGYDLLVGAPVVGVMLTLTGNQVVPRAAAVMGVGR